jgi:hypothetical protein
MSCLQYFDSRKGNQVPLKLHYASSKLRGVTLRTTVLCIIIPVRIDKTTQFYSICNKSIRCYRCLKKAGDCIQFETSFSESMAQVQEEVSENSPCLLGNISGTAVPPVSVTCVR